jgi:hypothetical protein
MTTQQEVLEQIQKTKNSFLNADKESLYKALNGASTLFLAYRKYGGSQGWSQNIMSNDENKPIYTPDEQQYLEQSFGGMSQFIDPIFLDKGDIQKGGQYKPGFSKDSLVSYSSPYGSINQEDISIDKAVTAVSDYVSALDEKNRILAKTLGPFKFIDEMKVDPIIPLPAPLVPIKVPARIIVPLITSFLEMMRLLVTFGSFKSDMLRKILSIVLAMADLSTGSWKNAVLTLAGVFGSTPLLLGIIGKLINNAWNLISPDTRASLSNEVYKGAKSMFIGFWLYMFSILAPDFARAAINQSLASLAKPLEDFNKKLGELESSAQRQLGPQGLQVSFQRLPLQMMPSLDDIQNIQVLAGRPEIYCSPEFQQVIQPMMKNVPIRLVLELMSVPTSQDTLAKACKGINPGGVAAAITDTLTPQVSPKPGGPLNRMKQTLKGGKSSSRRTRRRRSRR